MASFWRQRLSDEDDELDDVEGTLHTQNIENFDTKEEQNGQHISERVMCRKRVSGEGVRVTGRFDLEKKLFQLEEELEHLKEENKILKIELKRFRMCKTNIQPRREADQSYPGHRLSHLVDSEKKHAYFQQKVEERFMELERRIDKLEKTESKHQPQLGKKKDEILMKSDKEEGFIEQKRITYHDNFFDGIGSFHGNQSQSRKERQQNCKASEIKDTDHYNAKPVLSSNQGSIDTIQGGVNENDKKQFYKYEGSFKCDCPVASFFHFCLKDTIEELLKSVEVTDFLSNETKVLIRFHGSKCATHRALRNLQDLKYDVISETWNLLDDFNRHEILLIKNSFKSGQMKEKIDSYKYKEKCLVIAEFPKFVLASEFNKKFHQTFQLAQINIDSIQAKLMKTQSPWSLPADKLGFAGLSTHHTMTGDSESQSDDSDDLLDSKNLVDVKPTSNAVISLTTLNGVNSLESAKNKIVKDIRETCLHVDYFNQHAMNHWPRESRKKILKEAMRLSVWAEQSFYPKTKHVGFKLIGEKPAVAHIKAFIKQEFLQESKSFVSGNHSKLGQSQEAYEEKNKDQLLKQLEVENAKLQEAKTIKGTLEITLLQAVFLKPSFSDFKDCMIHFDANEKILVFYGTDSATRDCQMKLMLEMKKIKEETIAISSDMKSILSREKGKRYLEDLNSSGLNGAKVELDDRSLLLAAKEENVLSEAVKILRCKVDFIESVKSEVVIPHDRLTILKYCIELSLLVQVTFDDSGKMIKLLGIEDDVLMARRDVEKLFEEYGVYEKSFNVGEPEARFLHLCCEDQINSVLKSVDVTELTLTETKVFIRYKGSRSETHQVYHDLLDLKSNVLSKTWNLFDDFKKHELFLIANSLKNGQMKEKLETYKYREKILVISKFPDLTTQLLSASKNKKSPDKTKRPKSRARDSRPVPRVQSPSPPSANKLVYDISNTCQLVIKPYGDIIKEKSDILVSILGPDMDMRKTRVGSTFNKICPSHWKELQLVKETNPSAPVLTVKKPKGLNCLAVCHVILAIWNPSSSQQLLNVAIQTVLNEAKNLGAKSISFPALGCGRAFQFPPLNVAQQVLTSIRAMNVGSFLNKVTLLAPDNELFKELKSEAPKHFNAALPKNKAAPPQPAPPAQLVASDDSEDESDDSESSNDTFEVSNLNEMKNASDPHFTIIILHGNKTFDSVKKIITHDIREQCLHVDYFNQNVMKHWPRESRQKILKEAMKLSVWAERSIHPKTKHVGFQLIGEKPAIAQIKAFIHQEFLEESGHLPKRSLTSDNVPRRGTVEFMRYAADSDELFPSYWSLNKSRKFWSNLRNKISGKEKKLLVEVDKETKDAVTKLVTQTLDIGLVGQGSDAAGIHYSSLKVLDVKRVENAEIFELYRVQRKRLFDKMVRKGKICQDIGKLRGSKGRVCTTELLSDSMKKELFYEVNEHYLFHGTKSDTICTLIHNGLDPRLSNEAAIFGKGIYAAERATKSDQYTDLKQQRAPNGTKLTLILTRMLMGNVFLCDGNHKSVQGKGSKKLSRPPCMSCLEDFCKCRDQTLFDSVMGDGKWLFREFVVYESSQCYPEYVITYTRV